jgi:predicted nuclease of predicted toxin-antitoxin system
MLKLAADENFKSSIVRGLRRLEPTLDILRAQDVGLAGAGDPTVLAWAASEGRILCTHDINTMTKHARDRIAHGEPMSGVVVVPWTLAVGRAIQDLHLIAGATEPVEWQNHIGYVPL